MWLEDKMINSCLDWNLLTLATRSCLCNACQLLCHLETSSHGEFGKIIWIL